jgi:hypothetical protein
MAEQMVLSALHVGPKDLMVMRSLLNLAGGRDSKQSWSITDQPGGDITLIDVDAEPGEDAWKDLTHRGNVAIAMARRKDFPATYLLVKPLRSRAFLKLLEAAASGEMPTDTLAGPAEDQLAESVNDSIWQTIDLGEQVGHFTLAEHLRRQSWKKPVVITYPGWPLILIDPGSGAWFYDGSISDLAPAMFSQPMPTSAGVPVSHADLVDRIDGHRQRPLSELKWFAGLAQARGQLHPDLLGDLQFMLTQVPGEATRNDSLHALAKLLIRGPITLEELASRSGQPPENIMAFLNASYTSGKLLLNRVAQNAASF